FGADRPAGVVIFSDGRTTETTGFQEAAESYRRSGTPLHVFPVSDRGVMGDVVIQELVVPRFASPGSRVPVRVQIAGYGFAGRRAEIRIRAAANPWARPLASLPVTLSGEPETYDLMIEPDQAPGGDMVIEIPPLPGEAVTDNNQVPFRVASQVKKLRVIYMEATLGNEYHWLRDALVEDPTIECIPMEVSAQYVANQHLYRVGDPGRGYPETREELFHYDVVICSDISRLAFTPEQLDWTVELVARRGGGFAMVGGNTSFGAGGWDQTVWDQLIPVKMSGDRPNSFGQGYTGGEFQVLVPPTAERHPIWRIAEDPQQNAAILSAMPHFYGTNLIDRVKPGATLLGLTDRPLPLAGVMPVFACQSFGRGRTFAMTTDTTCSWGRDFESEWGEGDNRYFRKFWRNVVKWLAENSIGGTPRLRIETDKVIYRPGQPIQVVAHAYDDKLEETGKYRIFARLKAAAADVAESSPPTLEETPLLPGGGELAYRGRLTAPPISSRKSESPAASSLRSMVLEVIAYDGDYIAGRGELDVQVLDDSAEFRDLRPDPQRLEELAQISGGRVLHDSRELNQLLASIKPTVGEAVIARQPAWDNPALWFLLLLLLTVEWMFRRYRGLA
ncbi:MAG: glutamine amidotransferase, partial [Thermoguttaceae bacterium]